MRIQLKSRSTRRDDVDVAVVVKFSTRKSRSTKNPHESPRRDIFVLGDRGSTTKTDPIACNFAVEGVRSRYIETS